MGRGKVMLIVIVGGRQLMLMQDKFIERWHLFVQRAYFIRGYLLLIRRDKLWKASRELLNICQPQVRMDDSGRGQEVFVAFLLVFLLVSASASDTPIRFWPENIDRLIDWKPRSQTFSQSRTVSSIKPSISSIDNILLKWSLFRQKVVFMAKNTHFRKSWNPRLPPSYLGTIRQKKSWKRLSKKSSKKRLSLRQKISTDIDRYCIKKQNIVLLRGESDHRKHRKCKRDELLIFPSTIHFPPPAVPQ